MGIDYSVQVAYGFAMKKPPTAFSDWEHWEEDGEETIHDWLDQNGFDKLSACIGGNRMGDHVVYQIYIDSTETRFDPKHSSFVCTDMDTPDVKSVEQLVDAYNALDLGTGKLGWMVVLNVY